MNLQIVYSQSNFLPIIAFQGVPESHNTDKDFQNLKKAGFNVNLNMYSNINAVKKALTLCQKYNIKLIFSVPDLRTNPDIIKSVNNSVLESYADAFKVYNNMENTKYLNMEILRNNEIVELNYEID